MLFSLHKGKNDVEATEDFMKAFSKTSRTKAAVRSKIGKVREDFFNQINGITDKDLEKTGCFSFSLFFLFFSHSH